MRLRSDQFSHDFSTNDDWNDSTATPFDKKVIDDSGDENEGDNSMLYDSSFINRKRDISTTTTDEPLTRSEYLIRYIKDKLKDPRAPTCDATDINIVDLGILYDANYCADKGNTKSLAEQAIRDLIETVNGLYTKPCIFFRIAHLDGDCESQDLVGSISAISDSETRLFEFRQFWSNNLDDEFNVDAAILITGQGTIMIDDVGGGIFYGKAYGEGICRPVFKYGVVALTKPNNRDCPPPPEIVVAHELGHILGASHDPDEGGKDYVMAEKLGTLGGLDGFSERSSVEMNDYLDSLVGTDQDCVEALSLPSQSVAIDTEKKASVGFISSVLLSILFVGLYRMRRRRS